MPINVELIPGKQFASNEAITTAALNQLGQPTFTVSGTVDNNQLADGCVTANKVTPGAYNYGIATAVGNALSITLNPAMPAGYVTGAVVRFKMGNFLNTGPVTLNVNGRGAKSLVRHVKDASFAELGYGDLAGNGIYEAIYDGTRFQLLSPAASPPLYYATATGADNYTLAISPMPSLFRDEVSRSLFVVKFTNGNSGACTITIGFPLSGVPLTSIDNQPLVAGDIQNNTWHLLQYDYDANAFRIVSSLNGRLADVGSAAFSSDLTLSAENTVVSGTVGRVTLKSAVGRLVAFNNVNLTASLTAGQYVVGGYEQTPTAPVWWYLHAISNGTQCVAYLSTSQTIGTYPTGYSYSCLLGAFRTSAATTFVTASQVNRTVMLPLTVIFQGKTPTAANTWQLLDTAEQITFAQTVSPLVKRVSGIAGASAGATVPSNLLIAAVPTGKTLNATDPPNVNVVNTGAGVSMAVPPLTSPVWSAGRFSIGVGTQRQLQWRAAVQDTRHFLAVSEYEW